MADDERVADAPRSSRSIRHVAVVIPVHNEEETLADCLRSVHAAATAAWDVDVVVVVVLDDCSDDSARIAAADDRVVAVSIAARSVGTARSTGVDVALRRMDGDPSTVWIANTDADSTVPTNWVSAQVRLADGGADLVLGTVVPELDRLDAVRRERWVQTHDENSCLGHVHGANLGVRASAYLGVGGFEPLTEHEDVALAAHVNAAGRTVVATALAPVLTSARIVGRTPGGYAGALRRLGDDDDAVDDPTRDIGPLDHPQVLPLASADV